LPRIPILFHNENIKKMNLGKTLLATAVGGIVYFLAGWLVWGILLSDTLSPAPDVRDLIIRPDADFGMLPMVLSSFIWAGLLAYIFSNWAGGIRTFAAGAVAGALIAGLVSLSYDFGMVAMYKSNFMDMTKALINSSASAATSAVVGGVIGLMLGRGAKA
jgi:hypothetical protein